MESPIDAEPDPHGTAQLDLTGLGADRLTLKEKQDEASVAAIGRPSGAPAFQAALDEHGEVVPLALPRQLLLGLWGRLVRAKPE